VEDNRGQPSGGDKVLAYDYPVLGVFWSILMFFLWIMWFFLLFRVIADIFRSDDLGGWGKAAFTPTWVMRPHPSDALAGCEVRGRARSAGC
jgi:hypothetical protein